MSTRRAGALVWVTRTVLVLALPGPLFAMAGELMQGRIHFPLPHPGSFLDTLVRGLFATYTAYLFLLWAFGKIVCGVLAALTILVALQPRIEPRTRGLTVAAGSITCCLLLWWVNVVKY